MAQSRLLLQFLMRECREAPEADVAPKVRSEEGDGL